MQAFAVLQDQVCSLVSILLLTILVVYYPRISTAIEELKMAKGFALAIKSSIYGINIWFDAVGLNCKKGATTEHQDSAVRYMG